MHVSTDSDFNGRYTPRLRYMHYLQNSTRGYVDRDWIMYRKYTAYSKISWLSLKSPNVLFFKVCLRGVNICKLFVLSIFNTFAKSPKGRGCISLNLIDYNIK